MRLHPILRSCGALLGLFALGLPLPAFQAGDQEDGAKKDSSLIVLPIIFYMPETRWGGGAGGMVTFYPEGSGKAGRPSSLLFDAYATQNRQYMLEVKPEFYLRGGALFLDGSLSLDEFPNKYFGIGNDSPDGPAEDYTPRTVSVEASLQRKVRPSLGLYAGLQARFESVSMRRRDPDGELAAGLVPGSEGAVLTGLGFTLKWDDRDHIFFPRDGVYALGSAVFFSRSLGGAFGYLSFKLDLRVYRRVLASHVLALQVVLDALDGTAPFYKLPKLGGDAVMRGFYSGRYRDKVMLAFQAEYRLPLFWRFGLAVFGGLGRVAGRLSRLSPGGFHASAGFGLRFAVNREEHTNLRLDWGAGRGTSGVYFTVKEAF